ncbi:MAG: ATP-dependent helicase [Treponema sp.]|jgi:DNA helicase-2/ATP-dependent DNA helicase PcrA|nr:ATP-dependent helicase [Treponema sp.]
MSDDYPFYLEPLNPEQRQAVLHTGKPLLILAGAGSGKTRVITTKIAWLISEKGVDPRSILAVTFTNKAALEMAERARLIDERASNAMLRTFHSFGAWFLRRNGSFAGLDSKFIIYDDEDATSLLSAIMENSPKVEVKEFAYNISRAKDYFYSPDDIELVKIDSRKKFRDVYARYEERMTQIGNVDFGDLIKKPVEILRNQPEVARRFRDRFKVIMVDEYQDANVAQFRLLKELCGTDTYVCVVGDDDQSIYRFRGAEVKNILEFPDRFSGTDIIRLETNYRSTTPILRAASSVVDCNRGRLGKTLRANKGKGPLPTLTCLPDQDEEAAFCANLIKNSVVKEHATYSDWAVLYRTNAQSLGFETQFLRMKIPYRVVGSLKFYEREEIKDALAFLSFLVNPRDEIAFRRIVNKPARAVGNVTVDKIVDEAACYNGNLSDAGRNLELTPKARKGIDKFYKVIETANVLLNNTNDNNSNGKKNKTFKKTEKKNEGLISGEGLSVVVTRIIKDSGIADYHKTHDEVAGNVRINNLQELVNAASTYKLSMGGLLAFLEHIELDRSFEDDANKKGGESAVTLITFHNTKGLEFKRVIMTGLEQGIFPREEKKDEELEEERRLFYVGATRAMDELYFTTCAIRRMYGRTMPSIPSRFLSEIDKDSLQINAVQGRNVTRNFLSGDKSTAFQANNVISYYNGNNRIISNTTAAKIIELEERAGWKRGERLFHEDHGYGAVIEIRDSDDGPVVRVRFDNGEETRFLSNIQGRAYEKIRNEY